MNHERRRYKLNKRLKELRKTLDLTQQEFADRIGSKRNTIAKYETDTNIPSAAVVSLICREFNVNEEWLRNGQGEMFIEISKDEQIATFIGGMLQDEDESFKRRLISGLAALDDNGWDVLEKFLDSIQKKRD